MFENFLEEHFYENIKNSNYLPVKEETLQVNRKN